MRRYASRGDKTGSKTKSEIGGPLMLVGTLNCSILVGTVQFNVPTTIRGPLPRPLSDPISGPLLCSLSRFYCPHQNATI